MTTNNELLPCPFCGSGAIIQEHHPHEHSDWLVKAGMPETSPGSFTIECARCECGMIHETREGVVKAWNTSQPAMPADADPLQGAVDWLVHALPEGMSTAHQVCARLMIGHNRAERLVGIARRRIEVE